MSYRFSNWPYLLAFDPEKAKKQIRRAYEQTRGNAREAARTLGISEASFYRYAKRLHLKLVRSEVKEKP
jgi:transcriptional regulator of acetoin/glycerol metabolism